jgi:hypothetical protein
MDYNSLGIDEIMKGLEAPYAQTGQTKTARAAVGGGMQVPAVNSAAAVDAARNDVLAAMHDMNGGDMHKTAQAGASGLLPQGSVPQDATLALQKIASQLAAADRASLEAEARLYGAAVMDGILSRGEQTIKAAQDAGVFPAQVAQPQPQGEIDLYHVAATSAQKTAEYIGQQQRKTAEAQQADLDLYQVAATSAQKTAAFIAQQHKAAAASQASDPRVLHVPPPATSPSALEVQKVAQDLTSVCTQAFEQGHAMAAGVVAQLAGHAQ